MTAGTPSVGSSFSRGRVPHFKAPFGLAALLLLAATLSVVWAAHVTQSHRLDQVKLTALIKSNNCRASAVRSVSAERPEPKQPDASISLLSYRASCLTQSGKYLAANQVLAQLKQYYVRKHDRLDAASVEGWIELNAYAAAHPLTHDVNTRPETSPQGSQAIKQVFGNQK
jgi:hypothetical protein